MTSLVIHWFRRDLRLNDNLALDAAAQSGVPILPVFIFDPAIIESKRVGLPRLAFMLKALESLDTALRKVGSRLWLGYGDPREILPKLVQASGAIAATAVSAVITEPARAEAPASPLTGDWSCTDAINGHSSKYSFKDGGVLTIVTNEGQSSDYKYELAGKSLTLTDPKQVSTIAIEEMLARKMILHSGGAGQRVVCMR